MSPNTTSPDKWILVDTHVHHYSVFPLADQLTAAYKNMRRAATEELPEGRGDITALLCMLETPATSRFDRVAGGESAQLSPWRPDSNSSDTDVCVTLRDPEDRVLTLISGRQLVTSEGLEVLVIGTREPIVDHRRAEHYVETFGTDHLVIIPWALGKWLGKRGRAVNAIIDKWPDYRFALGDNTSRPGLWNRVRQFEMAAERGINILPGSDPLPIAGEHLMTGTYGVAFRDVPESRSPVDMLGSLPVSPLPLYRYGQRFNTARVLRTQISLRLSKFLNNQGRPTQV